MSKLTLMESVEALLREYKSVIADGSYYAAMPRAFLYPYNTAEEATQAKVEEIEKVEKALTERVF